jgi:hypothetical protein
VSLLRLASARMECILHQNIAAGMAGV